MNIDIRFIEINGVKYLRMEDVAKLLLEFGATEETDVRTRLGALVSSLVLITKN